MSLFRRARAARTSRPSQPPLGPEFTRLWCSSALTNLGDGALLAAGPLLIAALSSSATAVSAAVVFQLLPNLLLSLVSGALVDRLPRRAVLLAANLVRGAVLALLTAVTLTGSTSLWPVYTAVFLLGVGETLADTAYGSLVVSVVPRDSLGRANARLALTFSLNNQLIGPPLGALMFAAAWALPFGFDAVAYLVAVLIVARMRPVSTRRPKGPAESAGLWWEIAQGLSFTWRTLGLRTLCGCILVMNLTGVGAFSIWVVYAQEHLGLSDAGFGVFIAAGALGGVIGAPVYGWLEPRLGRAFLLRWGLVVEALTYVALALTANGVMAGLVMAVFGVHTVVWGTAAVTVRQRATPNHMLGRDAGVYRLTDLGGAALGALAGGLLADHVGLLVPFWLAAVSVGVLAVFSWRVIGITEQS